MEKLINMTPHAISIVTAEGQIIKTISASGGSVRLKTSTVSTGVEVDGVRLSKTVFGEPEGLPEAVEGTYIIVSQLVKTALPQRLDLLVPAEVVRDPQGNILGCQSLGI
jgi:hypothetical protein